MDDLTARRKKKKRKAHKLALGSKLVSRGPEMKPLALEDRESFKNCHHVASKALRFSSTVL